MRGCSEFACVLVVIVACLVLCQARQISQLQGTLDEAGKKIEEMQRDIVAVQELLAEQSGSSSESVSEEDWPEAP